MSERVLTAVEERFIEELALNREWFYGVWIHENKRRTDRYSVIERQPISRNQAVLAQLHGLEIAKKDGLAIWF